MPSASGNLLQSATGDLADDRSIKEYTLCGNKDRQKSRYGTWGEQECTYLEKHLGSSPTDNSYICKKHYFEAKRHGHEHEHVPSWKESLQSPLNLFKVHLLFINLYINKIT